MQIIIPHPDKKLGDILFKENAVESRALFDELVDAGKIKVNGDVINDIHYLVIEDTEVEVDGVEHDIIIKG